MARNLVLPWNRPEDRGPWAMGGRTERWWRTLEVELGRRATRHLIRENGRSPWRVPACRTCGGSGRLDWLDPDQRGIPRERRKKPLPFEIDRVCFACFGSGRPRRA